MEGLVSAPFTGYVYPNETIIPWTLLIAIYPYLMSPGPLRYPACIMRSAWSGSSRSPGSRC